MLKIECAKTPSCPAVRMMMVLRVKNEACGRSAGKRQREREISGWLRIPACVCGTAGKWNEKVVPGHKLTNPPSAHSDKSQRNTGDLTEQVSVPTVLRIKSSAPLRPKGTALNQNRRTELTVHLSLVPVRTKKRGQKMLRPVRRGGWMIP